ncbi:hypothetical protein [Tenacibaculum halocynthiae]|uniref:hypothetical protein n=1 Tax=Tenacibaculum halocynthiae TaxID=1254437 RepID=UPI003894C88E
MKLVFIIISTIGALLFNSPKESKTFKEVKTEKIIGSSFSLINDTKSKVSIYTGTGFVSLNKGSKTSISCKVGKEVRWAKSGRKGKVIFKIESKHCGKVLKLSKLL